MKILLWVILLTLIPSFVFASDFSDLQTLCSMSDGTYGAQPALILPHIDKKITKAVQYTKLQSGWSNSIYGAIFLHANTFTDDYKFLGSYLLRYDCLTRKTDFLTKKLLNSGWTSFWWQASLQYIAHTNSFALQHVWWSKTTSWIYDLNTRKLRAIDTRKIRAPRGKYIWIQPNFSTYDWKGISVEILYYTKVRTGNVVNYKYENYWNPDIVYIPIK
jgi:hypothetical protein